jgi:hypothetical protein
MMFSEMDPLETGRVENHSIENEAITSQHKNHKKMNQGTCTKHN